MTYIRKVPTASGAIAIQIISKEHGQVTKLEHIGSAHSENDLKTLMALARQRLNNNQLSLISEDHSRLQIYQQNTVSQILFDALMTVYINIGFNVIDDQIFSYLCIARLVEPTSKLDSIRVLANLGIDGLSNTTIHRCLKRIITNNYRDKLSKQCFTHASRSKDITLVLYDVTTLYFEIHKEDEGDANTIGYRKPGMSKERRLEPQIIVGLLVDQNGFPLELHSFEGNKAETKTIVPVIEEFKARHGLLGITVVADAGMLSAKNLTDLSDAGYTYIVGSKLAKIPYDIAQFKNTGEQFKDNQIITTETAIPGQRIIYQYRAKRASLDLRNIDKQIEKAKRIISGKATAKKAKFLTTKTKEKSLNQTLVDKAKALAGIKGYVTNLPKAETTDEQIIAYYHQLWHVEQSFRMSKSDLKARPIFHHKRDSIEAHLTIVLTALAIGKEVERITGWSIKKFVKQLQPVRSGSVTINNITYPTTPIIPYNITKILNKLKPGY